MARPHGKVLMGVEGGKPTAHWYDFVKPKRWFLRTRQWDGGCPPCKPGTSWVVARSLLPDVDNEKHSHFKYDRCKCKECKVKWPVYKGQIW